jgi:ATP-dependent exoDNAse (exonuclease V) alpha subunit
VVYQLLEYRDLENFIKKFFDVLLKKKNSIGEVERKIISELTQNAGSNSEVNVKQFERWDFFQKALANNFMVLSGKAGSGKTTAVADLVKKLLETHKTPIFILTSTGRSNLVIRDRIQKEINDVDQKKLTISTIHRFLFSRLLNDLTSFQARNGASYSNYKILKGQFNQIGSLFWAFLDGYMGAFYELLKITPKARFTPR